MKSFKTLLGAALVMAGFTACNNNNELTELGEAPQSGLHEMSFTVRAGGEGGTRSHLVNGASVVFDAGDAISVFDDAGADHNRKFTTTEGGSVATFAGTADAANPYYFLSPYQADATLNSDNLISATIPAAQTAVADSYDPAAMISIGYGTSTDAIELHNACALIKFTIAEGLSDISKITLYSTGKIAGSASFNAGSSIETYYGSTTSDQVSLNGTITAGKTYYICVLPGDLGKLTVQYVTSTGEVKERKAVNALTAVAGKLYDFGEISGSVYTPVAAWENALSLGRHTMSATGATSIVFETGVDVSSYTVDETHKKLNAAGTLWEVLDGQVLKVQTSADKIKAPVNSSKLFYDYLIVKSIAGLDKLDMSEVTDMSYMFFYCQELKSLDLSAFNTGSVTDMNHMFYNCQKLQSITGLDNFDTSSVENMSGMFLDCIALTDLDVSKFNTSSVTDMSSMFCGCRGLTDLDVSKFNTSSVTDMSGLFFNCEGLTALDVSNFNTSSVTDMSGMFAGCSGLTALDVSNFNTSSVDNMDSMFDGCEVLTALDISNFDTGNVTNMARMFETCYYLASLTLGKKFTMTNVVEKSDMFTGCGSNVEGTCYVYGPDDYELQYALRTDTGWSDFKMQFGVFWP